MSELQQPIVKISNLHKTFVLRGMFPWSPATDIQAVRGVDLSVYPGEVIALVGQSGSGKTTVSRMVLGLEEPSEGEIYLEGELWSGLSESQRRKKRIRYQYIPQDAMAALDQQQTALEHIVESYQILGGKTKQEAIESATKILTDLGLGQRLHALPREMSGGEQRRVTLARVLALEPKLVVADEPTSGLDPERRDSVLEELIGNLPKDAACILVTHDMSEATQWCDRIYAMLAGRVIEEIGASSKSTKTSEKTSEKTSVETSENPPIKITNTPCHPYSRILFDPWSGAFPKGELFYQGCPFQGDCSILANQKTTDQKAEVVSTSDFTDLVFSTLPLPHKPNLEDPKLCLGQIPELRELSLEQRIACHAYPQKP